MAIDNSLFERLASVMNSSSSKDSQGAYFVGTVVESDGEKSVMFSESGEAMPIIEGVDVRPGDTVMVYMKNHSATVTSNLSAPASGYVATELEGTVVEIGGQAEDAINKAEDAIDKVEKTEGKVDDFILSYEEASTAFMAEYNDFKRGIENQLGSTKGFVETIVTNPDGTQIKYVHDGETLESSSQVWKYTADAIAMSIDGGKTYPYGFTVDGNMIMSKISAGDINALGITAKDIYVGPNRETFMKADGSFQFGGANGIQYQPSSRTIRLGSDTVLSWDSLPSDVVSSEFLDDTLEDFGDDKADKTYVDNELAKKANTSDLSSKANKSDIVNPNLLDPPDLLSWPHENSALIGYDINTGSYTIKVKSGYLGAYISIPIDHDTTYTLSGYVSGKVGVNYSTTASASNLTSSGSRDLEDGAFEYQISSSKSNYLNIYAFCRYDSSSVDADGYTTAYIKYLKLEKGNVATPYVPPTMPGVVTQITKNTVTTEFINALNVTARYMSADWVYAGAVQASQIQADDLFAIAAKIGGFVIAQNYLETEKYITNKTDNNNYTERYGRLNPIRNGADTNAFLIVKERKVTAGNSSTTTKFKVDYDGNITANSITAMLFNPDFLFGIIDDDWIALYDECYTGVPRSLDTVDTLNDVQEAGAYYVPASTAGYPSDQSNSGRLEVKWLNRSGTRIRQILYPSVSTMPRYERHWNGSTWSNWLKYVRSGSTVAVSEVTAK